MTEFVCPRCGDIGYLSRQTRNGHTYYYCRHVQVMQKTRKERKCYLGADKYEYVELVNRMGLSGMLDSERFRKYLEHLLPKLQYDDLVKIKNIIDKELERVEKGRAATLAARSQL